MAKSMILKIGEAITGASLMAVCIVFRPIMRHWYSSWGATENETNRILHGDEYVPKPKGGYTQSISINAVKEAIWPWLVQIGQDKAGYYSYEVLENLVGCDIHGVDQIMPQFQNLQPGDMLIMAPKAPKIPVAIIEPEKVLAFGGRQDKDTGNIWIFFLEGNGKKTRLIVRWVFEYKKSFGNKVVYNWLLEPIASVMQRKMLLTIKYLVEKKSDTQIH